MYQNQPLIQSMSRREICTVSGIIVLAQFLMFLRCTPVPHMDASTYLEPGILLASEGRLAAPATQYHDLSYKIAYCAYPPGFFLLMAAWVKLFGYSEISILTFTHVQHALLLVTIWILARTRFGVSRISAGLAALSLFPFHHHGRPDLTSLCFAALAWWVIPKSGIGVRLPFGGMLLGMSVLASPHYGASAAAAVGTYCFIACKQSYYWRLGRLGFLIVAAVSINSLVIAVLLNWQDAWSIAFYQWKINLQFRGNQLNMMPSLFNPYAIKFCLIPLGLFTLLPVIAALLIPKSVTGVDLKISALCFLVGFLVWFMTNKSFLLYMGHFAYLARPIFHAALMSARSQAIRITGYISCSVLIVSHAYIESRDFVMLLENPRSAWEECRNLNSDGKTVAVDGPLFLSIYRPNYTISYEAFATYNMWKTYSDLWPLEIRECFDDVFHSGPQEPDLIIITTGTNESLGSPDPARYRRVDDASPIRQRKLFGIRTSYPMDYYHPVVYEKIVN